MPVHSTHRCPACDCFNKTAPVAVADETPYVGCEHCADPAYGNLCGYKILSQCERWTSLKEKIMDQCLVLRKDCPTSCTYSSWWIPGTSVIRDAPVITSRNCTIPVVRNIDTEQQICLTCTAPPCITQRICIDDPDNGEQCVEIVYTLSGRFYNGIPGTARYSYTTSLSSGPLTDCPSILLGPGACVHYIRPTSLSLACRGEPSSPTITNGGELMEGSGILIYPAPGVECDTQARADGLPLVNTTKVIDCSTSETTESLFCIEGYFGTICLSSATYTLSYEFGTECPSIPQPETTVIEGWTRGCTWLSDPPGEDAVKKWVLTITSSSTATLVGTARSGDTITYATSTWNCYDRSEFVLQSPHGVFVGMPRHLCIAPLNLPSVTPSLCEASTCDDGAMSKSFVVGAADEPESNTGVFACGQQVITPGYYSFARTLQGAPDAIRLAYGFEPDIYLPLQECSLFWRSFSYTPTNPCTKWPGQLIVVMATYNLEDAIGCSGTPPEGADRATQWTIFCYDGELETWVPSLIETCAYSACCDGIAFSTITGTIECCCPGGVTCPACGSTKVPLNLTWEVSGAGCITGSVSGVMTWVEEDGTWSWDNPSATGCQILSVRMYCGTFSGMPGVRLDVTLFDGTSYGKNVLAADIECDPFEVTATLDEVFNTGCCSGTTSISMAVTLAT